MTAFRRSLGCTGQSFGRLGASIFAKATLDRSLLQSYDPTSRSLPSTGSGQAGQRANRQTGERADGQTG